MEWVGDQLTGWGESSKKQNSKTNGLSFWIFWFERPLLRYLLKSESVTNLRTYLRTYLLTWVGARDTCVSKKRMKWHLHIYMALISGMFVLLTLFTRGLGNLTIVKLHKFHIHKDFKFYQFHWCWNIPMSLDIFVSYWMKICKNFSFFFPDFFLLLCGPLDKYQHCPTLGTPPHPPSCPFNPSQSWSRWSCCKNSI